MQHSRTKLKKWMPRPRLVAVIAFWLAAILLSAFGPDDSKASVFLAAIFVILPGVFIGGIPLPLSARTWNLLLWVVTGVGLIAATAIYNHSPLSFMILVAGFFCSHIMAKYNRLHTRKAAAQEKTNLVHGCSLVTLVISGIYMGVLGLIGAGLGSVGGFFFLLGGLLLLLGAFWGTSNGRKSK